MEKLDNLKAGDLKAILKGLKLYSGLTAKIGKRGKDLFHRELDGTHSYKVEYTSSQGKDSAWKQASSAFKKAFGTTPKQTEVVFIQNDEIEGGIKIFRNDDMVDLSLSMAINQIK
ncbi:hypothetical protein LR004_02245 [Candidatus Gracilibacteria bacterium]|nr:hypothetical protein [Candidatus Gracilibacteria bacterium]